MPTWLILIVALVIVVLASGLTTFLRVRRAQAATFEPAIRATRARLESLTYEIDTTSTDVDTAEPERLRDTAEAMLATASDRHSTRVCNRADQLLSRAERMLTAAQQGAARGRQDDR